MMKKWAPVFLLLALAIAVFLLKRNAPTTTDAGAGREKTATRDRGFARQISYLAYSRHARCRMDCRRISEADIKDIMRSGNINYRKSDLEKRCPVYAVEGYTNHNEHLRVVFAQCNEKTTVVTCYNLEQDFECYCPGDEKKGVQQ